MKIKTIKKVMEYLENTIDIEIGFTQEEWIDILAELEKKIWGKC